MVILSNDTNYTVKPPISTTYLALTDCDTNEVTVNVNNLPVANLGPDTTLCIGTSIILNKKGSSDYTYLWNNNENKPYTKVTDSGTYWLMVTNQNKCTYRDTVNINFVDCNGILEMPNIFSPNDDEWNNHFVPIKMANISNACLQIYNRWGEQIFKTNNLNIGWDGKNTSDGVYYWCVDYTDYNLKQWTKKGNVTIVR